MYCKKCGSKIGQKTNFCRNCGHATKELTMGIPSHKTINGTPKKKSVFWETLPYSIVITTLVLCVAYRIMGEFKEEAFNTFFGILIVSVLVGTLASFIIKRIEGGKEKNTPKLSKEDISKYKGLQGWLTIVILGLFTIVGYNGFGFFDTLLTSSEYGKNTGLFAYDFLSGVLIITLSAYVIYLFFARKRKFSQYYIVLLVLLTIMNVTILMMALSYSLAGDEIKEYSEDVVRSGMNLIIWGLYITQSKRVKATFIKD